MSRVIDAVLRLRDNFTAPLNRAMQNATSQARRLQNLGKSIDQTGQKISRVGGGLTKSITTPIVALGAGAIKTAATFEQGMSKVQSICLANEKQMGKLTEKAKEMGAKTKFSATESATAFQYMGMAGWKTKEMLAGIEPIMYGAGSSGEDLGKVSDIVTDGMTALGMQAKEAGHYVNVLAAAATNSNTNIAMMGETMKYIGSVGGAAKYNIDDLAVGMGVMANSGTKASQAGTAMRGIVSRMAKPTDEVAMSMKQLGISITDEKDNFRSFMDIMLQIRKSMKGLSDGEKMRHATAIAGRPGMSGLLALVNATEKDFNKVVNAIKNADVGEGAAKKMYDIANDNFLGRLTILKSSIETLAISFGDLLIPYVEKAVKFLQGLVDKLNSLDDKTKNQIIKWAGFAAAVGPVLLVVGKLTSTVGKTITGIGKFVGAIGRGVNAVRRLSQGASLISKFATFAKTAFLSLAGPGGVVVAIIVGIAAAAFLIIKNWDKVKAFLGKIHKGFKTAFSAARNVVNGFCDFFSNVGNGIIKNINSIIKKTTSLFSKLLQFVSGVFLQGWAHAWNSVKSIFTNIFNGIVGVCKGVINGVISIINAAINGINKIHITIPDWVPGIGGKGFGINIPNIPMLYSGTNNWRGGMAMIHDRGAEIVDLPQGSRVYPHDKSLQMARNEGERNARFMQPQNIKFSPIIKNEMKFKTADEFKNKKSNAIHFDVPRKKQKSSNPINFTVNINIDKLTDNLTAENDNDIKILTKKITKELTKEMKKVANNIGGDFFGYMD